MLNLASLLTPSAILAAFILVAAPSFAQERYHGRQNPSGQKSDGQSAERAQPRSEAPRAEGAAPRVESRQETPRAQQPRQAETPRVENRRDENRRDEGRRGENRRDEKGRDAHPRDEVRRAVPRPQVMVPRSEVIAPRGSYSPDYEPHYSPGYPSSGYSSPGYLSPGYSLPGYSLPGYSPWDYAPRAYYRPYVFRPRYSIGYGFFSGYPVPYTYSYSSPIWVYGSRAPRQRVMITPGSPYYGGVALEITPYDADVFVDGEYAGRVEDFDGTTQPLTLTAGTHRIEVQAPGYEPMVVDVGVQPGQVIPYRGDLRPY